MSDLWYLQPTSQNIFNLLNLVIAIAFSVMGTSISLAFSDSRDRNYDSLKLANEIICRVYVAYATFYLSIFLLVSKAQATSPGSWVNIGMIFLMLTMFVLTTRWMRRRNQDVVLAKRIGCPGSNCILEFECDPDKFDCRKEMQWPDIKKAAGGNLRLALWVLAVNIAISLSPITREAESTKSVGSMDTTHVEEIVATDTPNK